MLIKITDPVFQTILFSAVFFGLLLVSIRKNKKEKFFSIEVTNQLKGFAILAIIFSHIGYFLSADTRFLYPLSVAAGVGVNLFLFLSGFGLTLSHLKTPLSPLVFYKKRLTKLFIPLWIVISIILLIDNLVLKRTYPISETIHSFLGFYPRADLFQNLDSPLWYFSIILFYYLTFPLLFIKKFPFISPVLILIWSLLLINLNLPVDSGVLNLYKLHTLAFPLGIAFALMLQKIRFNLKPLFKFLILAIAIPVFLYTAIHSGVGEGLRIEQGISLITTASAIAIFLLLPFNFKLLSLFGIYSYEIYLFHWPIVSRLNLFLGLPPFLMVAFNLSLFTLLAYLLQRFIEKIRQ